MECEGRAGVVLYKVLVHALLRPPGLELGLANLWRCEGGGTCDHVESVMGVMCAQKVRLRAPA